MLEPQTAQKELDEALATVDKMTDSQIIDVFTEKMEEMIFEMPYAEATVIKRLFARLNLIKGKLPQG